MEKSLWEVRRQSPPTLSKISLLTLLTQIHILFQKPCPHQGKNIDILTLFGAVQTLCKSVQKKKKSDKTLGLCNIFIQSLESSFSNAKQYRRHMSTML